MENKQIWTTLFAFSNFVRSMSQCNFFDKVILNTSGKYYVESGGAEF